jgi:hypothetical protein
VETLRFKAIAKITLKRALTPVQVEYDAFFLAHWRSTMHCGFCDLKLLSALPNMFNFNHDFKCITLKAMCPKEYTTIDFGEIVQCLKKYQKNPLAK